MFLLSASELSKSEEDRGNCGFSKLLVISDKITTFLSTLCQNPEKLESLHVSRLNLLHTDNNDKKIIFLNYMLTKKVPFLVNPTRL